MHRHNRTTNRPFIVLGVIIGCLVLALLVVFFRLMNTSAGANEAAASSAVSSSASAATSVSSSSSVASSTSSESTSAVVSSSSTAQAGEITDLSACANLTGGYGCDSTGKPSAEIDDFMLDFDTQTFSGYTNGDIEQRTNERYAGSFVRVLKHADGSLVVDVKARKGRGAVRYFAILIAPTGVKISRNWQTNAIITDNTDATVPRAYIADAKDAAGTTYDLAPAYQAFVDVVPSTESSQVRYYEICEYLGE